MEPYCQCGSMFAYLHFYLHKYLNLYLYWSSDEGNMSTLTVCGLNELVKLQIVNLLNCYYKNIIEYSKTAQQVVS